MDARQIDKIFNPSRPWARVVVNHGRASLYLGSRRLAVAAVALQSEASRLRFVWSRLYRSCVVPQFFVADGVYDGSYERGL